MNLVLWKGWLIINEKKLSPVFLLSPRWCTLVREDIDLGRFRYDWVVPEWSNENAFSSFQEYLGNCYKLLSLKNLMFSSDAGLVSYLPSPNNSLPITILYILTV